MAEGLPNLKDPKLPPDQQPLHDSSNPNPVAHPPQALHPDRFTPGAAQQTAAGTAPDASSMPDAKTPDAKLKPAPPSSTTQTPSSADSTTVSKAKTKPSQQPKPPRAKPQENP